ncbi:MAG: hypothetical protein ACREQW_17890 [Candidatus Binatia bacterium]
MKRDIACSLNTTVRRGTTGNENVACHFQADAHLPKQYFAERERDACLEPEKRLMLAILEEAVYCFQDNYPAQQGRRKRLFDSAHRWFFGVSGDWIFSFENICSVLSFSPGYVRKGLVKWREKETSKHRCAA